MQCVGLHLADYCSNYKGNFDATMLNVKVKISFCRILKSLYHCACQSHDSEFVRPLLSSFSKEIARMLNTQHILKHQSVIPPSS